MHVKILHIHNLYKNILERHLLGPLWAPWLLELLVKISTFRTVCQQKKRELQSTHTVRTSE